MLIVPFKSDAAADGLAAESLGAGDAALDSGGAELALELLGPDPDESLLPLHAASKDAVIRTPRSKAGPLL
jgi:hypothetical protein